MTGLERILAQTGQPAKIGGAEIQTQGDGARHGDTSRDDQREAHQRVGEFPT